MAELVFKPVWCKLFRMPCNALSSKFPCIVVHALRHNAAAVASSFRATNSICQRATVFCGAYTRVPHVVLAALCSNSRNVHPQ